LNKETEKFITYYDTINTWRNLQNLLSRGIGLLGRAIFLSFFLLFTLVSAAVPVPLFPGNMVPIWIELSDPYIAIFLGAIANGATYGFIVWLVFNLGNRWVKKANLKKTG
jgi:protein-S-isoprenylcysteine O-methyltransferase Ste14